MRISFASSLLNFSPISISYTANTNIQHCYNAKMPLQQDIFVRNIEQNQISFGSRKFDDLCVSMKKEMCNYILDSKQISYDGLKTIVQKYCPDVFIEPFNEEEHLYGAGAAFAQRMEGRPDKDYAS